MQCVSSTLYRWPTSFLNVGDQVLQPYKLNNCKEQDQSPEKLTVLQLFTKFPALYETRRFITAFTIAHYMSLPIARSCESKPYLISWKSTLILFSYLCLDLQKDVYFPQHQYITKENHTSVYFNLYMYSQSRIKDNIRSKSSIQTA